MIHKDLRKKLSRFVLLCLAPIIAFYFQQFGEMLSDHMIQLAFAISAEQYVWQAYPQNHLWYLAVLILAVVGISVWVIDLLLEAVTHTTQAAE